jgi:hypothetical protein
MPENAGCLAFIDCDYQINIIEDSLRQSCIFEGLMFEWFKADIMHRVYKRTNTTYGKKKGRAD